MRGNSICADALLSFPLSSLTYPTGNTYRELTLTHDDKALPIT